MTILKKYVLYQFSNKTYIPQMLNVMLLYQHQKMETNKSKTYTYIAFPSPFLR